MSRLHDQREAHIPLYSSLKMFYLRKGQYFNIKKWTNYFERNSMARPNTLKNIAEKLQKECNDICNILVLSLPLVFVTILNLLGSFSFNILIANVLISNKINKTCRFFTFTCVCLSAEHITLWTSAAVTSRGVSTEPVIAQQPVHWTFINVCKKMS